MYIISRLDEETLLPNLIVLWQFRSPVSRSWGRSTFRLGGNLISCHMLSRGGGGAWLANLTLHTLDLSTNFQPRGRENHLDESESPGPGKQMRLANPGFPGISVQD